jgi:hypothetical protein
MYYNACQYTKSHVHHIPSTARFFIDYRIIHYMTVQFYLTTLPLNISLERWVVKVQKVDREQNILGNRNIMCKYTETDSHLTWPAMPPV